MVKLLGMLSVLAAFVVMGFVMARELCARVKALKDIYQSAIHIKSELEYRGADICDCFNRRGKLFSQAYKYIKDNSLSPTEALKKAAGENAYLKIEDCAVIDAYADILNAEYIAGQIANVNLFLENMRLCIREAEEEYQSKNRLYKSGGAIAGLGVIILLL